MNYRHVYHAGNFADVLKHAVLALVIEHLKLKPQPFRVIDTHAGTGRYDLSSVEAQKTGEWRDGIGRLLDPAVATNRTAAEILRPYLDVIRAENAPGALTIYPGSPLIARRLMRHGDRLVANEAHPDDAETLAAVFARDAAAKVMSIDGWSALKSLLPPKERRGVVLVDPPFEEAGEFRRLTEGLAAAHRRFATGTFILWYPIKDVRAVRAFLRDVTALGLPKLLCTELHVQAPHIEGALSGTGVLVLNPPFTLHDTLAQLLPYLIARLSSGPGAESRLQWLTGEKITTA